MLYFICHTSSGTSGEEEKGQSQEVDQEVSLCFILLFFSPASIYLLLFYLFGC